MPRLPSAEDLGLASPRSGRGIASADISAPARELQQTGGTLARLASDAQDKQDRLDYAYAKSELLRGQIEAQSEIQADNDYTTYEARYTKKMQEVRQKAAGLINNPEARRLFELDADNDILRGASSVREIVKTKYRDTSRASANEAAELNYNSIFQTKDPAARKQLLAATADIYQQGVLQGNFTAQEAQAAWSRIRENYAVQSWQEKFEENPAEALQQLKGGNAAGGAESAIALVLKNEGGHTPSDGASGAPAIFGINAKYWPEDYRKAKELANTQGAEAGRKYAAEFYRREFWDKNNLDALPADVQGVVMDGIVNHSGSFSKQLVEAAKGGASKTELISMRRQEYTRLARNPTYAPSLKGWLSRLDDIASTGSLELQFISPEKRLTLINKAEARLATDLQREIAPIQDAAKLGLKVPRENIEAVATKAEVIGQAEAATKLRKFADVQDATSSFALQDLTHQTKTIQSLKSSVEAGNVEDATLYEAYSNVYKNKLQMLKQDPWGFYSAHDVVSEPTPINFADPNTTAEELSKRRADAQAVRQLEGGNYQLPLLTGGEIDQLKELYEKGTPQQASAAISSIGQAMNQQERRALMQIVAPKSPALGVALSVEPEVSKAIMIGSKAKGEVPEAKVRQAVNEKIGGMVFDPEANEALHDAINSYYKKLALDAGDVAKEVDEKRLESAIEAVMGKQVSISPGRMSSYLPAFASESSKVFTYKDENGQFVDENRLEDILGGINDDLLKQLNGSLPYTSDGSYVTTEDILGAGQFRNFGDGVYTVNFPGLGGLIGKDGRPYTIDARKLEALQKSK